MATQGLLTTPCFLLHKQALPLLSQINRDVRRLGPRLFGVLLSLTTNAFLNLSINTQYTILLLNTLSLQLSSISYSLSLRTAI